MGRFSSVKGSITIARTTIIVRVNSTDNRRDWKCVDFENKSSKKGYASNIDKATLKSMKLHCVIHETIIPFSIVPIFPTQIG